MHFYTQFKSKIILDVINILTIISPFVAGFIVAQPTP